MKVTYIHHSSYLVETDSVTMLFDYFQGELPEIPEKKPLYVFASHRHGDHFSEVIFDLAKKYENMIFVLSYDIEEKRVPEPLRGRTYFLKPDEIWEHEGLKVETYRSTDEGVAFWCSADQKEIYHAGDLNHWYWDGEDEQWNKDMTAAYRSEIAKMRGRTADVAFLPLDPRQEQYFYLGIDDFVKEVHVKHIFPMHFWDQFDVGERLKALPCSEGYRDRIIEIKQEEHEYEV